MLIHSNNTSRSCAHNISTVDYVPCFFPLLRVAHFPFNNLSPRTIIIRLREGNVQPFPDLAGIFLLRKYEPVLRCTRITTNEVLNLNKLQGIRFQSSPLFCALCSLSPVSCFRILSREFCGGTSSRYMDRAPRTRKWRYEHSGCGIFSCR